jgi:hypothetical protein
MASRSGLYPTWNVPKFYFSWYIPSDEVLSFMQGEKGERWRDLCAQAAVEQDADKLLELTREITRLLDEKEQRLLARKVDDKRSA